LTILDFRWSRTCSHLRIIYQRAQFYIVFCGVACALQAVLSHIISNFERIKNFAIDWTKLFVSFQVLFILRNIQYVIDKWSESLQNIFYFFTLLSLKFGYIQPFDYKLSQATVYDIYKENNFISPEWDSEM
jgi:hypothetical protein